MTTSSLLNPGPDGPTTFRVVTPRLRLPLSDVVVLVDERAFTREDVSSLHPHGSRALLAAVECGDVEALPGGWWEGR